MPLSITTILNIAAQMTKTHDLQSPGAPLAIARTIALTSGTGNNQADMLWSDSRSAAANDSLDTAGGGLVDALGVAFALAKLKMLYVSAPSTNTQNVNVVRPATNGVPWLLAAGDAVVLPPGAFVLWGAPVAGVTVTAGSGDLVDITPASGTQAFDVVLAGTSA